MDPYSCHTIYLNCAAVTGTSYLKLPLTKYFIHTLKAVTKLFQAVYIHTK